MSFIFWLSLSFSVKKLYVVPAGVFILVFQEIKDIQAKLSMDDAREFILFSSLLHYNFESMTIWEC